MNTFFFDLLGLSVKCIKNGTICKTIGNTCDIQLLSQQIQINHILLIGEYYLQEYLAPQVYPNKHYAVRFDHTEGRMGHFK